jgi:PEP-CTERM motif
MFLLVASVLSTPALATDMACASPQPLNAAMGTGAGNGCTYVDSNFVNFLGDSPTGTGDAKFPTVTGGFTPAIEFTETGSVPSYALDFTTTGSPNSSTFTCDANSWCVSGNVPAVTASQSLTYDATTAAGYTSLTLTDGSLQTASLGAGNIITTEEQFCLGGASVAGCATANLGYLEITMTTAGGVDNYTTVYSVCTPGASGCTLSTPSSASITFGAVTQIGIEDTVTIDTIFGEDRAIFLNSFDNGFYEGTPEPSTFVLLGTGLAGFGILRSRRKKA